MDNMRNKIFLSVAAIFTFGALVVNAIWVHYYNKIDVRHVQQINEFAARMEAQERSYKRQLGEMRNRAPTPIVIDARKEIERVKND